METLKKYKKELLAGAGAAIVGWFLYKATTKQDDQAPEDQYEDENSEFKVTYFRGLYSKETVLEVYKKLNELAIKKSMKLISTSRKKRRNKKLNIKEYIAIIDETNTKRDELNEKVQAQHLKEMKLTPSLWFKSLEHYHLQMENDEDFKNKLTNIVSTYPKDFEFKSIPLDELNTLVDFMMTAAEGESPENLRIIEQLAPENSALGIEVLEARVYDKVFEKYGYEEDDIQISLRNAPEKHDIHKKYELFEELVDEIISGFRTPNIDEEEPAYVDGPDNEEDYEDVSDEDDK